MEKQVGGARNIEMRIQLCLPEMGTEINWYDVRTEDTFLALNASSDELLGKIERLCKETSLSGLVQVTPVSLVRDEILSMNARADEDVIFIAGTNP